MSAIPQGSGRQQLVLMAGIAALAAGVYLLAGGGTVLEPDRSLLQALGSANIGEALAFQLHPDQARPLANLAMSILMGTTDSVASVRVLSSILHGVNAILVFLLAGTLMGRGGESERSLVPSVAAGLLFAVHPLCSEAVLAHGSLAVVAGATFALGSLLSAARRRETGTGGAFVPAALYLAALLCHGGYWPVALVAAPVMLDRKEGEASPGGLGWIRALAPFAAALALFYAFWATRTWPEMGFFAVSRPWPVVQGIASQSAALVDALRLLVLPAGLSIDQGRAAYVGDWNLQALAGAALLVLLLGGAVVLGRRVTPVGMAVAWLAALHLHLLLAPPDDPLQERRLYPFVLSIALLGAALAGLVETRVGARVATAAAALLCLPLVLISMGRARLWADPVALWEDAVRVNPANPRALLTLAALHLEANQTDLALASYERALARQPGNAAIQTSIAEVYFARGDYAQALQEADKAMEMDPRHLPAYLTAGNSFMMRGQTRDAFLAFNAALTVNPDDPSALYNMGTLHYQEKQYVKASRLLQRAAELRPDDPEIHFRLGLSRFFQGDFSGAADALRMTMALAPERMDVKVSLAGTLIKTGEHLLAGQLLEEVLSDSPGNAEALNGLAILASARHDPETALAYFRQAVKMDPENLQYLFNLAGALDEQGLREEAIDAYRRFLDEWRGPLSYGEQARRRIGALEVRSAERASSP